MSRPFIAAPRGVTLVELLVVLVIIMLLGGIVYTGMAPARERASEARCLSNLHQIGMALQMYRQDDGGQDPPEAHTCSQVGLPTIPLPFALDKYLHSRDVWICHSVYNRPDITDPSKQISSYSFTGCDEHPEPPMIPFSQMIAAHGDQLAIVEDFYHGDYLRYSDNRKVWVLVLRLNGQVQRVRVSRNTPGWDW